MRSSVSNRSINRIHGQKTMVCLFSRIVIKTRWTHYHVHWEVVEEPDHHPRNRQPFCRPALLHFQGGGADGEGEVSGI